MKSKKKIKKKNKKKHFSPFLENYNNFLNMKKCIFFSLNLDLKNDIEIKHKLIELTKGNFRDDLCKLKYEEILPQTQIF